MEHEGLEEVRKMNWGEIWEFGAKKEEVFGFFWEKKGFGVEKMGLGMKKKWDL